MKGVLHMQDKLAETSMSIIVLAGEARLKNKEAFDAIVEFDFSKADAKIKEAKAKIVEAHKLQTSLVQSESRGETLEYSALFSHAQDTLMVVFSEVNMAKQMVAIFESYEKRIAELEGKNV
jgi:PTS system cellobiose-specific IIA component